MYVCVSHYMYARGKNTWRVRTCIGQTVAGLAVKDVTEVEMDIRCALNHSSSKSEKRLPVCRHRMHAVNSQVCETWNSADAGRSDHVERDPS